MFEVALIANAAAAYAVEHRKRQLELAAAQELVEWEREFLPCMDDVGRAEYQRKKERTDDIRREERQHRELVEAENRKARALEELGRRRGLSLGSLAAGFILGEIVK